MSWRRSRPTYRPTFRRQGAQAIAVVAGTMVGLLRTGGIDAIWAEDGQNFLTDALNRPWYEAIFTPFNGYFHVVARALWGLIALFPIEWAAALNAGVDALVTSLLALGVYRAAAERVHRPGAVVIGVCAALPMGFVPNALAQLQFPLVYAGLWMLLWRRTGPLTVGVPALAVLNSMLGVLLVPVAIGGLVRYRSREWAWKVLGLAPGAVLQLVPMLTGATERGLGERPEHDPVVLGEMYLRWGIPRSFLGTAWPDGRVLVVAGLAVPAALVAIALWRRDYQALRAAGVLGGFAALAGVVQLGAHGGVADRYLVLVSLPNIAAGVVLVGGREPSRERAGCRQGRTPFVVFATLLVAVLAVDLRAAGPWDASPRWGEAVGRARVECLVQPGSGRVSVHTARWPDLGWEAVLPCSRLR
ncbi:hypothetical protein [Dactylosporangium sp. CA-139066]|uniref:hypothetical protein n=1 Tax=Dactylosporangium sp. CA-139066 TaxID=3239930 RepID=UPI003D929CDA